MHEKFGSIFLALYTEMVYRDGILAGMLPCIDMKAAAQVRMYINLVYQIMSLLLRVLMIMIKIKMNHNKEDINIYVQKKNGIGLRSCL